MMAQSPEQAKPQALLVVPTLHAAAPPLEAQLQCFFAPGPELEEVAVRISPPETPLELLEKLGGSPFERGGFPLVGFLATTYDKVSRYALQRAEQRGADSFLTEPGPATDS